MSELSLKEVKGISLAQSGQSREGATKMLLGNVGENWHSEEEEADVSSIHISMKVNY